MINIYSENKSTANNFSVNKNNEINHDNNFDINNKIKDFSTPKKIKSNNDNNFNTSSKADLNISYNIIAGIIITTILFLFFSHYENNFSNQEYYNDIRSLIYKAFDHEECLNDFDYLTSMEETNKWLLNCIIISLKNFAKDKNKSVKFKNLILQIEDNVLTQCNDYLYLYNRLKPDSTITEDFINYIDDKNHFKEVFECLGNTNINSSKIRDNLFKKFNLDKFKNYKNTYNYYSWIYNPFFYNYDMKNPYILQISNLNDITKFGEMIDYSLKTEKQFTSNSSYKVNFKDEIDDDLNESKEFYSVINEINKEENNNLNKQNMLNYFLFKNSEYYTLFNNNIKKHINDVSFINNNYFINYWDNYLYMFNLNKEFYSKNQLNSFLYKATRKFRVIIVFNTDLEENNKIITIVKFNFYLNEYNYFKKSYTIESFTYKNKDSIETDFAKKNNNVNNNYDISGNDANYNELNNLNNNKQNSNIDINNNNSNNIKDDLINLNNKLSLDAEEELVYNELSDSEINKETKELFYDIEKELNNYNDIKDIYKDINTNVNYLNKIINNRYKNNDNESTAEENINNELWYINTFVYLNNNYNFVYTIGRTLSLITLIGFYIYNYTKSHKTNLYKQRNFFFYLSIIVYILKIIYILLVISSGYYDKLGINKLFYANNSVDDSILNNIANFNTLDIKHLNYSDTNNDIYHPYKNKFENSDNYDYLDSDDFMSLDIQLYYDSNCKIFTCFISFFMCMNIIL